MGGAGGLFLNFKAKMAAVLEDTLYLDNIEEHVQDDNGIVRFMCTHLVFNVILTLFGTH